MSLELDMTDGIYRRIYAGYLTGRRINAVSLEAEAWFWRLHALADDFGNLQADPTMLVKLAAPRRDMTVAKCIELCNELKRELIAEYAVAGERYFHVLGFEDRQPAGKNGRRIRKVPAPVNPGESGGIQNNPGESGSNGANPVPPIPIPTPIPIPMPTPNKDTPPAAEIVRAKAKGTAWGATFSGEIYAVVWKKVNRTAALKAIDKAGRELTKRFDGDAARAFVWLKERTETYARSNHVRTCDPKFLPHPATWFNAGGYDDDERAWAASNEPENVNETSFEKMLREQANAKATGSGSRGVFGETLSPMEGHAGIVDPLGLAYRAIPGNFGATPGDPRSAPN